MQVDVGELADHLIQHVGLAQPVNLDPEIELLDDVLRRLGEPPDVEKQGVGDRVGVVEELGEGQRAGVVELLARHRLENGVDVLDPARELLVPLQERLLGRLKDAIQAGDYREREDHLDGLRLLVVPAQKVGDRPDEYRVITDRLAIGHDYAPASPLFLIQMASLLGQAHESMLRPARGKTAGGLNVPDGGPDRAKPIPKRGLRLSQESSCKIRTRIRRSYDAPLNLAKGSQAGLSSRSRRVSA